MNEKKPNLKKRESRKNQEHIYKHHLSGTQKTVQMLGAREPEFERNQNRGQSPNIFEFGGVSVSLPAGRQGFFLHET